MPPKRNISAVWVAAASSQSDLPGPSPPCSCSRQSELFFFELKRNCDGKEGTGLVLDDDAGLGRRRDFVDDEALEARGGKSVFKFIELYFLGLERYV